MRVRQTNRKKNKRNKWVRPYQAHLQTVRRGRRRGCFAFEPRLCFAWAFAFFDKGSKCEAERRTSGQTPVERNCKEEKLAQRFLQTPPTIWQLRGSPRARFDRFTHRLRNNYQQSLTTALEQRKKTRQLLRPPARENSSSGCVCEAEGRGGGGLTESTKHAHPRGSAGTTLIWPRRNNGTNCSDSAAQWPLLVRQARHVTGIAGAAQWFEHRLPASAHAAQNWRTTSIQKTQGSRKRV